MLLLSHVSKKLSIGLKRSHGLLQAQSVVQASLWPEEYFPTIPEAHPQIISRNGEPFSMEIFRKVYDVCLLKIHANAD